jgi:hypothetical protein
MKKMWQQAEEMAHLSNFREAAQTLGDSKKFKDKQS